MKDALRHSIFRIRYSAVLIPIPGDGRTEYGFEYGKIQKQ